MHLKIHVIIISIFNLNTVHSVRKLLFTVGTPWDFLATTLREMLIWNNKFASLQGSRNRHILRRAATRVIRCVDTWTCPYSPYTGDRWCDKLINSIYSNFINFEYYTYTISIYQALFYLCEMRDGKIELTKVKVRAVWRTATMAFLAFVVFERCPHSAVQSSVRARGSCRLDFTKEGRLIMDASVKVISYTYNIILLPCQSHWVRYW